MVQNTQKDKPKPHFSVAFDMLDMVVQVVLPAGSTVTE